MYLVLRRLPFFFSLLLCFGAVNPALQAGPAYKVLYDSTKVKVAESGLSYVDFHQRYRILTAAGSKELSTLHLDYDPLSAFVEFREAVIHRRNGEMEIIDLKTVMDYPAPARAIYWGARRQMLSVGRLYPGDELEVKWFRKGFTYALLYDEEDERYIPPMRGHFYDIVEFWSNVPINRKVYQVDLPDSKTLQYKFYHGKVEVSQRLNDGRKEYTFTLEDIQPFKREPNMVALSDVAPKLLLSTSPDWEAKSRWFYGVNEDFGSFEWDEEIKAKVDEILLPARNEYDSIALLTHWVADEIRYSGLSMGEGEGYTLHKASMTYTDRSGVCKDKAGLLVAMLRAAGFESWAAMTMAGSRIEDIPADQFNHSVTVVKLKSGEYRLLDPTWVPFVRELWSSAEQQQQYLLGLPEGADLMTTPVSPPQAHYLRMEGFSRIDVNGNLMGGFTLTAEGQSDAAVRRLFTSSRKDLWRERIVDALQQAHPAVELRNVDFDDPYDYQDPILLRVEYSIPNYALVDEERIIFTPFLFAAPFKSAMNHLMMQTEMEDRQYPFRDRCSREVSISESIAVPSFTKIAYHPPRQFFNGAAGDFEGQLRTEDGNTLVVDLMARLNKRVYEDYDWPSYREVVNWHKKYGEEPIILER